jgi:hypothetical protein
MTDLSFKLSRAVARGRAEQGVPKSRAQILVSLLRMRAEAHRLGLGAHERSLRNQIGWALPIEDGEKVSEG